MPRVFTVARNIHGLGPNFSAFGLVGSFKFSIGSSLVCTNRFTPRIMSYDISASQISILPNPRTDYLQTVKHSYSYSGAIPFVGQSLQGTSNS